MILGFILDLYYIGILYQITALDEILTQESENKALLR